MAAMAAMAAAALSLLIFGSNFKMFLEWAKPGLFFVFFSFFSHHKNSNNLTINDKSVDGMHGTRTRGGKNGRPRQIH